MSGYLKRAICLLLCCAVLFSTVSGFNIQSGAISDENVRYIEEIGAAASKDMQQSGILASLTIAQAIFEAGWGTSMLAQKANNLFGMKAYSSYTGMVIDSNTGIVYNSYKEYENANTSAYVLANKEQVWRAYASRQDSLADHSKLLTDSSRYDNIPGEYDYVAACWNIVEDGYASDMEYAKKIINCIEMYDLSRFDIIDYPADQVVIAAKTRKYLPIGETYDLPVTVMQPFGGEDTITYTSNRPEVATVDENGVITAVAYGECLITATSSTGWHSNCYVATYDPNEKYTENTCRGNINMYEMPNTSSVKFGYLPNRHCVISIGDSFTANDGNVWIKVHAKVLTSTEVLIRTGYVLANGLNYVQKIDYTKLIDTVSVTLDQTELTMPQYKSITLTATPVAEEENATPSVATIRWISDNPAVATVIKGKVRGVGVGECNIYAISPDGVYASCKVTVTEGVYIAPESITLDKTDISLYINGTDTLTATVTPEDVSEPEVIWESSNSLVAKVSAGRITAVNYGECVITARVGDLTAACTVTVSKPVFEGNIYYATVLGNMVNLRTGPGTNYTSLGFMYKGDLLEIYGEAENSWYKVKVLTGSCQNLEGYVRNDMVDMTTRPVEALILHTQSTTLFTGEFIGLSWEADPLDSEITFESSDTAVATVDEKGVVTAVAQGSATITASAGEKTAQIVITVADQSIAGTKYYGVIATNGGTLFLREGAGTEYNVLGRLPNGGAVTVYGEAQNGWYKVSGLLEDGVTLASGYASAEWVKVNGAVPTGLYLSANHASLMERERYTITYTIAPEGIKPTFTVSDASIATVNEQGEVKALAVGKAYVTVTAGDKTAVFTVVVTKNPTPPPTPEEFVPVEGITLTDEYILGASEKLGVEQVKALFENNPELLEVDLNGKAYAGTGATVALKNTDGEVLQTLTLIIKGDCDGSGTVNSFDYLLIRSTVLGLFTPDDIQKIAADLVPNGNIDSMDYLLARSHVLGIYNIFTGQAITPDTGTDGDTSDTSNDSDNSDNSDTSDNSDASDNSDNSDNSDTTDASDASDTTE